MKKTEMTVKEKILDTAISLFHTYGYHGTTIRAIAGAAKVNSANISYYFHGKQGLLEACFVRFFEPYLACLEEEGPASETADERLKRAVYNALHFQSDHHLLARFVWREITIDSQIVREITSTYLMKERYLLKKLVMEGLQFQPHHRAANFLMIQLRSMLAMPYLNSQYLREVWGMQPEEPYFADKYAHTIADWLDSVKQMPSAPPLLLKKA
ncbi:forespore capture DNA-binding protein RefZ [Heyndrickxia acidiproducens]|jgi:AcrR family transcriptional regulator|uniref:forespore capture DNA-binding protein RefZ n=1 Tax=Heyndrickxia acidiproducens TaxID=1121084 RepID=UPI0003659F77|nr:forespore capture DNA-binding protein RefZ [Heyndrickxia acidiproducens]